VLRRSSSALSRTVGEEIILATPESPELTRLSGTGAALWRLLDRPRSLSGILKELERIFSADRKTLASDLELFVADLTERGLIEEVRQANG
jgi:hypothetical protein